MSLFAILYSADDLTPEQVIGQLFPDGTLPPELDVSVGLVKPKNYILQDVGVPARVEVYFTLDKERAGAARRAPGAAVRAFVGTTTGDLVLMYYETPVVRRSRTSRDYARDYSDLDIQGWTPVDEIRLPRDEAANG